MKDAIRNLRDLRKKAARINATLVDDLKPFFLPERLVFRRLPSGSDDKGNVTNTCSCLMALVTSGKSMDFLKQTLNLNSDDDAQNKLTEVFEKAVESEWTSSGLVDDNAFSSLIVLRTAALLSDLLRKPALEMSHPTYELKDGTPIKSGPSRNLKEIADAFGSAPPNTFRVDEYPPTPGIAYWFVDAVEKLMPDIGELVWGKIASWTSESFARQLSLVSAQHDAMKDPVAMALAACLATRLRRIITVSAFADRDRMIAELPTKIEVERAVLNSFNFQEPSGIWPKYFPLFNYKKEGVGSNYLFSFEVLEVIVHEFEHSKLMENELVLSGLERALDWCESNRLTYALGGRVYQGWNSGGQITTLMQGKPEAWATAMVHMFLWKLRSALSRLIQDHILTKYGASRPSDEARASWKSWDALLDSPLEILENVTSAKEVLREHILNPVEEHRDFRSGLIEQRKRSALLFGPPGTAKTSTVRAIAKEIEWPLVELNPSHFLRRGLENIYSEADEIFNDLEDLSQTVVFFDEMDALAQRRGEQVDVTRQFLTTSMLPKLSRLHDESRVLFFMATNHLRSFDEAITRPGRFDLLVHVRPPLWRNKLEHLESVWPGRKRKDLESTWPPAQRKKDKDFVKTSFASWAPPTTAEKKSALFGRRPAKVVEILDRFTPGELESFLETIGEGPALRTGVEAMTEKEFVTKVDVWGKHYIALHSESRPTASGDLSLLGEFELDKSASRM